MTTMTEEWVSLWYQCLAQNIDYSLYCNARDDGDETRCAELEAQFDKIRNIYEDFGMLDGWPEDGMQSSQWAEWFEPRKHLFLAMPRDVADPVRYVSRPGYTLVEIPLQADVKSNACGSRRVPGQQVFGP